MKPKKLLQRLRSGALSNVAFDDFVALLDACGFVRGRTRGSHQVFYHPRSPQHLNLQPRSGCAKEYQIREFLRMVDELKIQLGAE